MKKVVSYLLSLLIMVQCFCVVPFNTFADESEKYSICYTKFVLSDNSTEYTKSIIRDDYLMVDVQWLCDKLGLKYRKFNTLTGTSGAANNYFIQRTNLMSSEFFNNGFSVSKPDLDFSFIFQAGNKEAVALSGYLGSYSVNLGTKVTPVTDENGNVSHYVPLFAFCEIFNVAYDICIEPEKNYIVLPEPNITAIDILHMQNILSKYETHNCLVNAINDDLLSFLEMALGESLSNTIDSIVSLKLANLVDPTKDNYELLALQMCSSDTDEADKIAAQNDCLDYFYSASTEVYGSLIEAAQEYGKNKQPLYEEIVKDEYRWSLSAWEKTKNQYDNVCVLGKVADISEVVNKYIGLGAPMIFNGLSLIFETASAQDNYLKFMNTYLEYADETLSKEEKMGYNYIQDRMKIYESSFDDAWTLLSDEDMLSNITTFAAEELTGLQLGKLGLAVTAGKWGVNLITGGSFDFNDIYYNCMVNQKFQNGSQKVVDSYINSSDFNIDTYRALEWTRLKAYYVANENGLELYNQYYEISKFNADTNPILSVLYQVGFGEKDKYSNEELGEFAEKLDGFEIYEIDSAFEDYNIMIGSKAILDYESKKINSDTEKLAEYMSVLLYGADGTTPENVKNCESFAAENNKRVLENNYALYQSVEGKVAEAQEKTPVEDAGIIFTTDKGIAITCTTDEKGNMLGLDGIISNSFADDINSNKNTQGILEENDPENQDNAFIQYEPNIKYSTVELYLPVGSYSLDIKASGYKDYKHESKVEVKLDEKCELGEILLEIEDMAWRGLYRKKLTEIMENSKLGSNAEFDLIYVNEDDIPELIVRSGDTTRLATCYLFTFVDGKVIEPGNANVINSNKNCWYGEYGTFTYLYKQNTYMVTHMTPQYCYNYDVYDLDRTLLHSYVNGFPFNPPESGWATADGISVTQEEIQNKTSQYNDHNLYVNCNFQYKLNKASINSVLSDAPQEAFDAIDEKVSGKIKTSAELTVYAGPGEYFDEIDRIPENIEIEMQGTRQGAVYGYPVNEKISDKSELRDKWIYILYDGKYGWIKEAEKQDDLDILIEKARAMYNENGKIESVYAIVELGDELCLIEGRRLDLDSYYNLYNSKNELITSHSSVPLQLYNNGEYSLYAPFAAGGPIFIDAFYPEYIASYIVYPEHIDSHSKEVKWDGYIELNDEEFNKFCEKSTDLRNMHKIQYYHDGMCEYIELK